MLSRRSERRQRITDAFAGFRRAVAVSLGAATKERDRAALTEARKVFELWLRQVSSDEQKTDEEKLRELTFNNQVRNPVFADIAQSVVTEWQDSFAVWTSEGPRQLEQLVAAAAPGAASEPPESWLGTSGTHDGLGEVPQLWRIGTAVIPRAPVQQLFPVAVPLLDESHLHLSTTAESRATAETLVESLLLRVLSYFQPGLVHLHVWDVGSLTGSLPGLYPLARAGLLTVHNPARLHEMLHEFAEHIRRIHTSVLVGGRPTLKALASATGRRTEPWRIAVLFGNRAPLKEDLQQDLQRIARTGLACGIQLIIVDIPITVNSAIETIKLDKDQSVSSTMTGKHASVTLDPPLPKDGVPRACSMIADALLERRSRLCNFDDLMPTEYWKYDSSSGLQAPVGFYDGDAVYLRLGDPSPHALIGGPSGSGKTNFLYAMLAGLTARYSPADLELYLLDFKEGVSFAQFAPGRKDPTWLPHARLVGVNVNQDREFGLALLRFLSQEMRRRADAAKQHEVTKLEQLRAEDPQGHWPRIVAVIDEFQYLFAQRDPVTEQATALLEDVARRGRSQGIHLVLASQDVSGIEAFWGKPAIFEQFTLRVALPKARRVLVETNMAAAEIPRFHAVVNHDSGVFHGNEIARIPDATSKGTFDRLQNQLCELQHDLTEPRLFDGSHRPRLSTVDDYGALLATPAKAPTALLGQVIDLAGSAAKVRLNPTPGRNVATIGSVIQSTTSVLAAAALSLARQHTPGEALFTIGCLVDDAVPSASRLAEQLRADGHDVDLVGMDGIRSKLNGVAATLNARITGGSHANSEPLRPHYLLLYAVDAAYALLEHKEQLGQPSGMDSLRQVLKHGPELRTHVIGWWRSVARMKAGLMVAGQEDIGAWVAFDVQGQELSSLAAGQLINWSPRPGRGLFFDRFEHARPEVVIPFDTVGERR